MNKDNQLQEKAKQEVQVANLTPEVRMKNFQRNLNRSPHQSQVKTNKFANNSQYIPISHLEMLADKFFYQNWDFVIVSHEMIGNSIVVHGRLTAFHPIHHKDLTRDGIAAIDIQVDKDGRALAKSLQKAYPTAKAMAFKNAVQTLGKAFGRDVSRSIEDAAAMPKNWLDED